MNIDFSSYSPSQRYHVMTQTIIPRPIAWVLSHSGDDINAVTNSELNLAPFSYFTPVSSDPAIMMISVGKKPNGELKDTVTNALKHKKLVIHIANEQQAGLVTETAATLAHGESELNALSEQANLSTTTFDGFELPRLSECDIAYGCELYEVKELGNTPQTLLFVEIKQLYVSEKVAEIDQQNRLKVFADKVQPLARLGASEYAGISAPFKHARPA